MSPRLNLNLQQAWWTVFPILLGAWLAVRLPVGAYLYLQPKVYESIAVLDESPAPGVPPGTERTVDLATARAVAVKLDLPSRWKVPEEAAADVVRNSAVIRRSDDGTSTEIICRHEWMTDARDIAAMLAESYQGWLGDSALARLPADRRNDLLRRDPLRKELEVARQHVREWNEVAESNEQTNRAIQHVRDGKTPPREDPELIEEINAYRALLERRDSLQEEWSDLERSLGGAALPPPVRVTVLQPAQPSIAPVTPNIQLGMFRASMAAPVIGILAWWLYLARIRTPLTPEQLVARKERAKRRNAADY